MEFAERQHFQQVLPDYFLFLSDFVPPGTLRERILSFCLFVCTDFCSLEALMRILGSSVREGPAG